MKARELMTRCPDVVTPDDSITAAAEVMHYSADAFVPVVRDTAGRVLAGVITARDIVVRCVARHHPTTCHVRDHMTPLPVHALSLDDDVSDAAKMMCDWEVRRIPVVTESGVLAGVIHEPDLRRALSRIEARQITVPEESTPRRSRSRFSGRSSVAVPPTEARASSGTSRAQQPGGIGVRYD